jgi:hypothetical protein
MKTSEDFTELVISDGQVWNMEIVAEGLRLDLPEEEGK